MQLQGFAKALHYVEEIEKALGKGKTTLADVVRFIEEWKSTRVLKSEFNALSARLDATISTLNALSQSVTKLEDKVFPVDKGGIGAPR